MRNKVMSIYKFESINGEQKHISTEIANIGFFFTQEPRYFIYILNANYTNELIEVSETSYINIKELISVQQDSDLLEIFCVKSDEISHILEFIKIKSFSDSMTIAESLDLA